MVLTLRAKKIYSQQVFHIASSFCGKVVDWIYKLEAGPMIEDSSLRA
jgi:hypothetical protein